MYTGATGCVAETGAGRDHLSRALGRVPGRCKSSGAAYYSSVRGQQRAAAVKHDADAGSRRRARGADRARGRADGRQGITPACAGSRNWSSATRPESRDHCPRVRGEQVIPPRSASTGWDHPRVRGEQGTYVLVPSRGTGSPPRARGAGTRASGAPLGVGITPACAGSRVRERHRSPYARDHPRVRGEQAAAVVQACSISGLPPRARGAAAADRLNLYAGGITPACAGSRAMRVYWWAHDRDHPRVRGEQARCRIRSQMVWGSPPRARGADGPKPRPHRRRRITPACAGSSCRRRPRNAHGRDHPRVRGEQFTRSAVVKTSRGSPPRARGAGRSEVSGRPTTGITPACAGSRRSRSTLSTYGGDHPRVRGEQGPNKDLGNSALGSPPRARGAATFDMAKFRRDGITPACAGSRPTGSAATPAAWDHPRVRGEQATLASPCLPPAGSPPRARGADFLTCGAIDQLLRFYSLWLARSPLRTDVTRAAGDR